ncbi:zinc finger protein 260-like [Culicoides brevitarsis]|uniref:zinc finger protein 260-like n=1 Tax=Culicoides brevitarsis TaxID=469753 RepID=UPI00307B16C7
MSINFVKIENETLCRFCLAHQGSEDFHDIDDDQKIAGTMSIRDALLSCTNLDVRILETYNKCCNDCFSKLSDVYEFLQGCQAALETLQSYNVVENDNSVCQEDSFHDISDAEDAKEAPIVVETITCNFCFEQFDDKTSLETHIKELHPVDRRYSCPTCGKGFQSVSNRNTHMQLHNTGDTYKCLKCEKTFKSKVYLSKHTKFVHSVNEKKCEICNKTFVNAAKYKYHARSHDASKQFHCKYCPRSFIQVHHLQNHERTHTGVFPFLCTVCGQRFKVACNLNLHMRVHNNDRKFVCEICSKAFIRQSAYKSHMKGHSSAAIPNEDKPKEFQCECGRSFHQKSSLKVHLRTHSGEKPFECQQCDKRFSQRHQLTYHVKALHTKMEKIEAKEPEISEVASKESPEKSSNLPYICTICDKRFKVPSSLLTHAKIHTEDRKFSCDKCNAKFKRREHLRIHVNGVHLKLKPFKCEICDRTFSQIGDRNVHMKSHSDQKEHSCTICNKKFRLVKALRTHLRIHTGEKPYSCTFCQKSFTTYMAMAAHTEKCQATINAGQLTDSGKDITVITLASQNSQSIQSIEIPAGIVLTVPITKL